MRHLVLGLGLCFLAGVSLSCSSSDADFEPSQQSDQIYGGTLDSVHTSVVAVYNRGGGACSGTVVRVNGKIGYVLTAAHCVVRIDAGGNIITPVQVVTPGDLLVIPGLDWLASANASSFYPATELLMHPGYNGVTTSPNDIALIRFLGADASTPTTQVVSAAQDDLAVNDATTLVGYGQTQTNSMNSSRYALNKNVSGVTSTHAAHSRADGTGTCQGDSGGPMLKRFAGVERVVAVHSYSQGSSCANGQGVAVRTSQHETFINNYLNGTPGAVSCDSCLTLAGTTFGGCDAEAAACDPGTPCDAYLVCGNACASGDSACVLACGTTHAAGARAYSDLLDCSCADCPTECGGEAICSAPSCGLAFADTTCNTCNEAQCCAETQACTDNAACRTCAVSPSTAGCSANALYNDFLACNRQSCGVECGGGACGFSNDGACGDCINNECCSQGSACAGDASCFQCATAPAPGADCANNAALNALFSCLGSCNADPCGVGGGSGGAAGAGGGGAGGGGAGGAAGTAGSNPGGTGGGPGGGGPGGSGGLPQGGAGPDGGAAGSGATAGSVSTGGAASTGGGGPAGAAGSAGDAAGSADSSADSGCGCSTPARKHSGGVPGLLALLSLVALARRRRRAA